MSPGQQSPTTPPGSTIEGCTAYPDTSCLQSADQCTALMQSTIKDAVTPIVNRTDQLIALLVQQQQSYLLPLLQQAITIGSTIEGLIVNFFTRLGVPVPTPTPYVPYVPILVPTPPPVPPVVVPPVVVPPVVVPPVVVPPAPSITSITGITNLQQLITYYLGGPSLTPTPSAPTPPATPPAPQPPGNLDTPVNVPWSPLPPAPEPGPAGGPGIFTTPPDCCELAKGAVVVALAAAQSAAAASSAAQAVATAIGGVGGTGGAGGTGGVGGAASAAAIGAATATSSATAIAGGASITLNLPASGSSSPATTPPAVPPPPARQLPPGSPPLPPPDAGLPAPPATPQVGVLGAWSFVVQPADKPADGSWASRADVVRLWLIDLGNLVLTRFDDGTFFPAVSADAWREQWRLLDLPYTRKAGVIDRISAWSKTTVVKDVCNEWARGVIEGFCKGNAAIAKIMAARAYLDALRSVTIAGDYKDAEHKGLNVGLGGEGKGAAAAAAGGVESSDDLGFKQDVQVLLLLLIELSDYALAYEARLHPPGTSEILEMVLRNRISWNYAERLLRYSGVDPQEFQPLVDARSEQLSADEAIEYARRTGKPREWIEGSLRRIGFTEESVRAAVQELYDEIPPVTDLLRFAQRNVTVPEVVERFGLEDEFNRFWFGDLKEGLTAQGISERWAHLYWRAHWVTASISTGQDALRRLRPGRVPKELEFTTADMQNLFRENDVLPFWRSRLVALAYQPLTIRFLREGYRYGTIAPNDLIERLQDIGYSLADAQVMQRSMEVQRQRQLASDGHGWTPTELRKLYAADEVTEQFVRQEMTRQSYPREAQDQLISSAIADRRVKDRATMIAGVKQHYISGAYDVNTAQDRLVLNGVPIGRAVELVRSWLTSRRSVVHHDTAAQLQDWYARGLLTLDDYSTRLLELGYTTDDVNRAVNATVRTLTEKQQKAQAAALAKRQAQLEKDAKARKAAQDKAAKEFKKLAKIQALLAEAEEAARLQEELAKISADKEIALGDATTTQAKAEDKAEAAIEAGAVRARTTRSKAARKAQVDRLPPL